MAAASTALPRPTTNGTTEPSSASIWKRIYDVKDVDGNRVFYDEWAENYDKDTLDPSQDYVAPTLTAQAVLNTLGLTSLSGLEILDAGCGTGQVGTALKSVGSKSVDGVDLSNGMLKVARKTGAYRDLDTADMSVPLNIPSDKYDVVTCIGTLTQGHVKARPAIEELVRVTKKGGLIVATVLEKIWAPEGYKAEVHRLAEEGQVEIVGTELIDYRRATEYKARLPVLRKK